MCPSSALLAPDLGRLQSPLYRERLSLSSDFQKIKKKKNFIAVGHFLQAVLLIGAAYETIKNRHVNFQEQK